MINNDKKHSTLNKEAEKKVAGNPQIRGRGGGPLQLWPPPRPPIGGSSLQWPDAVLLLGTSGSSRFHHDMLFTFELWNLHLWFSFCVLCGFAGKAGT